MMGIEKRIPDFETQKKGKVEYLENNFYISQIFIFLIIFFPLDL